MGTSSLSVHIREADASDVEALARLVTEWGYPALPEHIGRRLAQARSDTSCVFVAVVADEVIGWVHISLYPTLAADRAAEVLGLVVNHSWRGQGVGRQLMNAAEAWCFAKGCRLMYVRSRATRAEAHAFYRRLGYRVVKASLTFVKRLAEGQNGSER